MSAGMLDIVGWDVGGVNIKAARVVQQAGTPVESRVVVRPFEIWRGLQDLSAVLAEIGDALGLQAATAMAITMTAELSDAFRSKREGVLKVFAALSQVFPYTPLYPLSLGGHFVPLAEARQQPLEFAASNWLASALCLADKQPDCILVDVGSTTTDIIPIRSGRVASSGRTDTERLTAGELLYSGVLRTNPNTIVAQVPVNGRMCRTAAESFTLMADVYLLLDLISAEAYTCPTADGRAKSPQAARERLARLVCADAEMLSEPQLRKLARYLFDKQVQQVTEALHQVVSIQEGGYRVPLVTAGAGAFVAAEAGVRLGMKVLDAEAHWGVEATVALPAQAVAYLLARRFEEENRCWTL